MAVPWWPAVALSGNPISSFGIHRAALQPDYGDSLVGCAQVWVTAQSGTASNRVSVVSLKMEKFSPAMKSLMAPSLLRNARHKGRLRISLCAAANGPRLHNRLEEGFEG